MTVSADPQVANPPVASGRRRRITAWIVIAAVLIGVGIVGSLLAGTGEWTERDVLDPESAGPSGTRALIEIMEQRERMVHLLNQYIEGPGLTVVIGGEHTTPGLRPFSLVAATAVDGTTVRTVGVIGPTRMHYSRAIALVDGTTQAVTRVLRDSN